MAETFITGVGGGLYFGGQRAAFVGQWGANVNTGVADTPDLGSSGPKRAYTKYHDWTGSLSGQYRIVTPTTGADTAPVQENITLQFVSGGTPSAGMLKLKETSQSMYYGNVVLSNIAKGQAAEGLQSFSCDWAQAEGPLDHATSTST